MTIRNLESAFNPQSIAVVGASEKPGSVGTVVLDNILSGDFEGEVFPVNPKYAELRGLKCHKDVASLPKPPDISVIMTPAQTVPDIIAGLGEIGSKAAVVLSAGITDDNGLRQKMLDAARPHLFRIVGPNTIGLILPPIGLNASFSHMDAEPGKLALLSQSGAMITSIIDWAAGKRIGFSALVSLGDMADVDVADCLDMLAYDRNTAAVLMYLESIPNPRKFMSAARAASRMKPVIAIKSGRHEQSAKAAATHTGALAGMDAAVDAALERAGVLRVVELEELFDAAEITARFGPLKKSGVAIVTNGGGAGVLAMDRLGDLGCRLANLSDETMSRLNEVLPTTWSHANPVDVIGDANPKRYEDALGIVAQDPDCDALMVLNCPTGLASSVEAARAVAAMSEKGRIGGKPVLACWLGGRNAEKARAVLQEAGIASFETPGDAATSLDFMTRWSRAQAAMSQVPAQGSFDVNGHKAVVEAVLRQVAEEERTLLTEPEAKTVLKAYGIPVPETLSASNLDEVEEKAAELLKSHEQVVIKVLSRQISHKSDIGGVVLGIGTPAEARAAAFGIRKRAAEHEPDATLDGFTVQPMVKRKHAVELLIGVTPDEVFGPVIMFGAGGTSVEVVRDTAMALPPLDDVLGRDLISRTRVSRLLEGYRDVPAAQMEAVLACLNGVSQMVVDFPALKALDINPLLANHEGVIALDARVEIDPKRAAETGPNKDLPVRPYPSAWERTLELSPKEKYLIRPIKPADITLYDDFFEKVTPEDMRFRFLSSRRRFSESALKRLTQIDYEREMAFVALEPEGGKLAAVARLASDPDGNRAEYGVLVRSDLQRHGIGHAMLDLLVEYGRSEGIEFIDGYVLSENTRMLDMCRDLGFEMKRDPDDAAIMHVSVKL